MARSINVSVRLRDRESPERLIKRFLNKVKKEKIIEDVLDRRYYESPSEKKSKLRIRRKRVLERAKRENI